MKKRTYQLPIVGTVKDFDEIKGDEKNPIRAFGLSDFNENFNWKSYENELPIEEIGLEYRVLEIDFSTGTAVVEVIAHEVFINAFEEWLRKTDLNEALKSKNETYLKIDRSVGMMKSGERIKSDHLVRKIKWLS